jgi:hypothetical protein
VLLPLSVTFFIDYLPTNSHFSTDETIANIISQGNSYEYIEQGNYIFVAEFYGREIIKTHFMYKGEKSNYIPTPFAYGTGDKVKIRIKKIAINDGYLSLLIKKHKNNYVIQIGSFNNDIVILDERDKEIESISSDYYIYYFEVVSNLNDEFEYHIESDADNIVIVNHAMIREMFGD